MKRLKFTILFIFHMGLILPGLAQELSSKQVILHSMELANNYFMAKWPDPGVDIVTDKTRPSNLWTRATYYEGLMTLYYTNQDPVLYQYAVDWGESHSWNPTYGNLTTRDGDHHCCGQTYIELYKISGNADWIGPITTTMDNMVDDDKNDDWSWIDAIQMAMPVFAKLGDVHNDTAYFDKMYKMYSYTKRNHGTSGLYNTIDHLWYRDRNFDPPTTTPNGLPVYWSRGNGWVYAALVRVLSVIPENETHRAEYLQDYKDMSASLLAIQREDGFWNPSLVDPNDWGGKETSGTGFFIYGLAWGINNGYLDSATYIQAVVKGWEGMQNDALHDNGFLGWVQGTGSEPSDGQPLSYDKVPNFEDYGLGTFLLAGSEVYKLAGEGIDSDEDGIVDELDNCPAIANEDQADTDEDGIGDVCDDDLDGDGYNNDMDNCPLIFNDDQSDMDEDGDGDVCDNDADGDGFLNEADNCPLIANMEQADLDEDGEGDLCDDDWDGDGKVNETDNCPLIANSDQADFDEDGDGDACDDDDDGDAINDDLDQCPGTLPGATVNENGCSSAQLGISLYKDAFGLKIFPNPSNGEITVEYELTEPGSLSLVILNTTGQVVKILQEGSRFSPGEYTFKWNPGEEGYRVKRGTYFLQLITDNSITFKQIIVL